MVLRHQPKSLTVEPGPFIVVSGHDLRDLETILKQTESKALTSILTARCFLLMDILSFVNIRTSRKFWYCMAKSTEGI